MSKAGRLKQEKKLRREKRKKRKEKEIDVLERDQKKLREAVEKDRKNIIIGETTPGRLKISEIVNKMIEPLLEGLETEEEIRATYRMGILAWNAAILQSRDGEGSLRSTVPGIYEQLGEEASEEFDNLIQYKIDYYSEYNEFILDHILSIENGKVYLSVVFDRSQSDKIG